MIIGRAGCVAAIKPLIFLKKVAKYVEIYIEIPPPPQQTAKIDPLKAAFPPYPQLAWR
jgi:hypothetical protein